MKLIYISLNLGIILSLFSSCTNHKAESTLLTDKQSCSVEECPSPQSKITGNLYIESDAGSYQLNVDKSDVIEIAGKCSDLGLRNHRILVELYEGEDVSRPNALIMENSASPNCTMNTSTPSLNGQRCFWVTNGHGVIDSGTEYPQCFNGRFAFSVKLGRILRTTEPGNIDEINNPKRKYMVRFKIRANDGAISESAWNSTLIERGVSKPTFRQDSNPLTSYKCDVQINAFKNLESLTNITYEIKMTPQYLGPVNGSVVDVTNGIPISYLEPIPSTPLAHVTNYRIPSIIPGVKYNVTVKAFDRKYIYSLNGNPPGVTAEESPLSDEYQCGGYTAFDLKLDGAASSNTATVACAGSTKLCRFKIDNFPSLLGTYSTPPFNDYTNGYIELLVIKGKTEWAEDFEPAIPPASIPDCGPGVVYGTSTIDVCRHAVSVGALGGSFSYDFKPEYYPKNVCTDATNNSYKDTYAVAARYINNYNTGTKTGTQKGAWSQINLDCKWTN